jgi:hypothetical protein
LRDKLVVEANHVTGDDGGRGLEWAVVGKGGTERMNKQKRRRPKAVKPTTTPAMMLLMVKRYWERV